MGSLVTELHQLSAINHQVLAKVMASSLADLIAKGKSSMARQKLANSAWLRYKLKLELRQKRLSRPFPVLVGNNRVYSRCELVITSQEIALLLLPHSVHVGTPPMGRRSSHFLTPPHTAGVRVEEPCEDDQKHSNMYFSFTYPIPRTIIELFFS